MSYKNSINETYEVLTSRIESWGNRTKSSILTNSIKFLKERSKKLNEENPYIKSEYTLERYAKWWLDNKEELKIKYSDNFNPLEYLGISKIGIESILK
mgnify:CR=1 FL=1|tara:strand:+ start:164 stop:457 length:294 start_codon:yes stop_codon:yes gene_type:complete